MLGAIWWVIFENYPGALSGFISDASTVVFYCYFIYSVMMSKERTKYLLITVPVWGPITLIIVWIIGYVTGF